TAKVLRPRVIRGAVDDHIANFAVPEKLGLRREGHDRVNLVIDEELDRLWGLTDHPIDVFSGVKSDIRRHDRHQQVRRAPQTAHGEALTLELGDAPGTLIAEQFETPDMHPSKHLEPLSDVDGSNERRRVDHREIGRPPRYRFGYLRPRRIHITNFGKAFG